MASSKQKRSKEVPRYQFPFTLLKRPSEHHPGQYIINKEYPTYSDKYYNNDKELHDKLTITLKKVIGVNSNRPGNFNLTQVVNKIANHLCKAEDDIWLKLFLKELWIKQIMEHGEEYNFPDSYFADQKKEVNNKYVTIHVYYGKLHLLRLKWDKVNHIT